MRCVLDTNLLVSGIIAAGAPRRLLRGAMAGEFTLCTSETLLAELLRVLARSRFSARLGSAGSDRFARRRTAIRETWVGPGRWRKSTRPGANGVVELSPFDFSDPCGGGVSFCVPLGVVATSVLERG